MKAILNLPKFTQHLSYFVIIDSFLYRANLVDLANNKLRSAMRMEHLLLGLLCKQAQVSRETLGQASPQAWHQWEKLVLCTQECLQKEGQFSFLQGRLQGQPLPQERPRNKSPILKKVILKCCCVTAVGARDTFSGFYLYFLACLLD